MTSMIVRPAIAADIPAVLPMVAQICAMHEAMDPARYPMLPDVVARYERWLPQRAVDPESVFLVAESGADAPRAGAWAGKPIPLTGFLIATVERNIPIYRLDRFGYIHDVWVEPVARGSGIGKALVLAAVGRFRAIGITQVRLETAAANEGARRLFAACGFRAGTIDMLLAIGLSDPG